MALKTMSIAKLRDLRSKIEAAISARVGDRCRELEAQLSKLDGFGRNEKASKFAGRGRKGPVAPKYRNPENTAAIKSGKKLEDFAMTAQIAKSGRAKASRK